MELRYFDISEFDCSHTGENEMSHGFLVRLDELRHQCGFPFHVTSGYRSVKHPIEAAKERPGMHSKGRAADIFADNAFKRGQIVYHAINLGFKGIGVSNDFIHVDDRDGPLVMWGYD